MHILSRKDAATDSNILFLQSHHSNETRAIIWHPVVVRGSELSLNLSTKAHISHISGDGMSAMRINRRKHRKSLEGLSYPQYTVSTAEEKRRPEFAPSAHSLGLPQSPPGRASLLKHHILLVQPFHSPGKMWTERGDRAGSEDKG